MLTPQRLQILGVLACGGDLLTDLAKAAVAVARRAELARADLARRAAYRLREWLLAIVNLDYDGRRLESHCAQLLHRARQICFHVIRQHVSPRPHRQLHAAEAERLDGLPRLGDGHRLEVLGEHDVAHRLLIPRQLDVAHAGDRVARVAYFDRPLPVDDAGAGARV